MASNILIIFRTEGHLLDGSFALNNAPSDLGTLPKQDNVFYRVKKADPFYLFNCYLVSITPRALQAKQEAWCLRNH
jgi:hypothetical protein